MQKFKKLKKLHEKMTSRKCCKRPDCEAILSKRQSWVLDMNAEDSSELIEAVTKYDHKDALVSSLIETKISLRFYD
jgi:hypothetical protein